MVTVVTSYFIFSFYKFSQNNFKLINSSSSSCKIKETPIKSYKYPEVPILQHVDLKKINEKKQGESHESMKA